MAGSSGYQLISSIGQAVSGEKKDAGTSASYQNGSGFLVNVDACLPIEREVLNRFTLPVHVIASGGSLRSSLSYTLGIPPGRPSPVVAKTCRAPVSLCERGSGREYLLDKGKFNQHLQVFLELRPLHPQRLPQRPHNLAALALVSTKVLCIRMTKMSPSACRRPTCPKCA